MTYGQSMRKWESNDDDRRERIWRNELEDAIAFCKKDKAIELMRSGLLNAYDLPDFPEGSWAKEELEKLKEAGY